MGLGVLRRYRNPIEVKPKEEEKPKPKKAPKKKTPKKKGD